MQGVVHKMCTLYIAICIKLILLYIKKIYEICEVLNRLSSIY